LGVASHRRDLLAQAGRAFWGSGTYWLRVAGYGLGYDVTAPVARTTSAIPAAITAIRTKTARM
jgi:hypothetical protein